MEGLPELSSRNQRWSLNGKTALVTGGTRGIGYAIVEELAEFGARVHTCSRNEPELTERLKVWEIKGYNVTGSVCDLTCREQIEQLMETVSSLFDGKLNILVNNAGTIAMKSAVDMDLTSEDCVVLMRTNFETPFHICQIAHPLLKASENGSIVFISSVAGEKGLPQLSVYAASKGAINQLTRNLAYEWTKDKIRTNAVSPWAVNTTISDNKPKDMELSMEFMSLISRTPIKRIAEPNEISPLVAFLCLPVASYINGQVINVDGGFTIA